MVCPPVPAILNLNQSDQEEEEEESDTNQSANLDEAEETRLKPSAATTSTSAVCVMHDVIGVCQRPSMLQVKLLNSFGCSVGIL